MFTLSLFRLPAIAAATALVLTLTKTQAQPTVSGFTPTGSWSGLKVGTAFLSDAYDAGNASLDPTKQSSLAGSNKIWDMVGNSTTPLFQIAEGTTSSGTAYGWSIRLADFDSNGLKTGSVGLLLSDTSGYYGYAMSFAANGAVSLYRIRPVEPVNLTPSGFTFTYGNNTAASNTTAVSSGGILYSYAVTNAGTTLSASSDAWLTFVVPLTEIRAFTGNNLWTYNSSIGATAFTTSQPVNGSINADYAGTSTTALTFSSESGTVASVPEIPTALFTGVLLAPLAAFKLWRRRRAAGLS
jgi:hypothetical protein